MNSDMNVKKAVYIKTITLKQINVLDLFDDILYKHIKPILETDDYEMDVEIEDKDVIHGLCVTSFKFTLPFIVSDEGGGVPNMKVKTYTVIKYYGRSSPTSIYIAENLEEKTMKEATQMDEGVTHPVLSQAQGQTLEEDEWSDEEVSVTKFTFEGKDYLRDEKNVVYDMVTPDELGIWMGTHIESFESFK